MSVLGVVFDFQSEELGSLYQTIHADGQILTADVDIAGVEQRQHAALLQLLQVLVVRQLHLVHQVDDLFDISLIRDIVAYSVLDSAVEVDGQYRFRTRRHTTRSQRVAEAVVGDLVTQTAAAGERVGIVAHVGEERVTGRIHLCGEVAVLLVLDVAVLGQQRHCLYREGQDATGALLVEPAHETTLQPVEAVPVRLFAVGEVEIAEERLEIVAVVVADIPEHRLVVTRTGGLVQAVHHLLEIVADELVDSTTLQAQIDHFVSTFVVVVTILLLDEVVHIHKELGRSARA